MYMEVEARAGLFGKEVAKGVVVSLGGVKV